MMYCEVMYRMRTAVSVVLVASLAGLSAAADAQEISNPKLFGKSLEAAHQALEFYGELDDVAELQRTADIAYEVAMASGFRDFPFSFYLVDMPEPNAFALPGGHIFVTRGMLQLGLSDDMLACLLGHEIAHVVHRHGTRMQRRATLLNAIGQALVLGVLLGADDGPENPYDPYGIKHSRSRKGSMVQGTAAATLALSELLLRDYSREFEDEADESGQRFAAAAGYDPQGASQLWALMNARIPQSKAYGYWRTHPFSDQRLRAAEVRAAELKIQEERPTEDYRAKTQQVLLGYREKLDEKRPLVDEQRPELDRRDNEASRGEEPRSLREFLEFSALTAWPQGPQAETIRLALLHELRAEELNRPEVERDYGKLMRSYVIQMDEVRALTPDTAFLATLEKELNELRGAAEEVYPKAVEVWESDVYQIPFLETFLSNFPTASQAPDMALVLGNAYSRLGRQADAVSQYLRTIEAGPETEAGEQARQGLRNLAPYLTQLAALQQLADARYDNTLRELAQRRLEELVDSYEKISNGAEYLRRYPESSLAEPVRARLELLARNLYGEVVLYQGIGDHVKALDRIQQILTHAPTSEAAEMLRERAKLESSRS